MSLMYTLPQARRQTEDKYRRVKVREEEGLCVGIVCKDAAPKEVRCRPQKHHAEQQ